MESGVQHATSRVVVLISGRGSNLARLLERAESYAVVRVISDRADAPGLHFARERGIEVVTLPREDFPSRAAQRTAILLATDSANPQIVALAGFMQILTDEFVERFYGRLVNIHPSLLPHFPGLDTHARALREGVKEHGCTVHFVDAGMDTGPRIAQWRCPVHEGDTEEELAARVLVGEHLLYPFVVNAIARRQIALDGRTVEVSPECREAGRAHGLVFPPLDSPDY